MRRPARGLSWRLPARGLSARPGGASGWGWAVGRRQRAKRFIHCCGILESFGNIRVKNDNVGAFQIPLIVLPANSAGEVVFGPHLVCFESMALRIHIAYARE